MKTMTLMFCFLVAMTGSARSVEKEWETYTNTHYKYEVMFPSYSIITTSSPIDDSDAWPKIEIEPPKGLRCVLWIEIHEKSPNQSLMAWIDDKLDSPGLQHPNVISHGYQKLKHAQAYRMTLGAQSQDPSKNEVVYIDGRDKVFEISFYWASEKKDGEKAKVTNALYRKVLNSFRPLKPPSGPAK